MKILLIIPLFVALTFPGETYAGITIFPHQGCDGDLGWKEFNGHCYKLIDNIFSNEPDTHSEMLSMCQRVGPNWYVDGQRFIFAYLADIQSLAENDFVAEIVAGGERAWIGAARQEDDTFSWVRMEDTAAVTYGNWKPWREPNNQGGNEDCVEINRGPPGRGMWNDIRCTVKRLGVCKYNIAQYAARVPKKP